MEIISIKREDRYFKEIVNYLYNWWGYKKFNSYDEFYKTYLNYITNDNLPNLYALIINDTLIGAYEINEKDYVEEKEYTPYLANIFIKENYRGQKYSSILIEDCVVKTKKLGYNKLYLHTKIENYYEKYGFKFKEEAETKYGIKRIYEKDLS